MTILDQKRRPQRSPNNREPMLTLLGQRVQFLDVISQTCGKLREKRLELRNLVLTSSREPSGRVGNNLCQLFHRVQNSGKVLTVVDTSVALLDRLHLLVHRIDVVLDIIMVSTVNQVKSVVQLFETTISVNLITVVPGRSVGIVSIRRFDNSLTAR